MTPHRNFFEVWPQHLTRIRLAGFASLAMAFAGITAQAQEQAKVVDIPTRPSVMQRFLYLAQPKAVASVILFTGGNGGLQIAASGSMLSGNGNFLVRSRQLFADAGFAVAVIDAPSDRQSPPYLSGNRQTPEHKADVPSSPGSSSSHPRQCGWSAPAAARSQRLL